MWNQPLVQEQHIDYSLRNVQFSPRMPQPYKLRWIKFPKRYVGVIHHDVVIKVQDPKRTKWFVSNRFFKKKETSFLSSFLKTKSLVGIDELTEKLCLSKIHAVFQPSNFPRFGPCEPPPVGYEGPLRGPRSCCSSAKEVLKRQSSINCQVREWKWWKFVIISQGWAVNI